MLERLWVHIQAFTIIALANSPGLFILFMSGFSSSSIDLASSSYATEYAMVSTFEIHQDPEINSDDMDEEEELRETESKPEEKPQYPIEEAIPKSIPPKKLPPRNGSKKEIPQKEIPQKENSETKIEEDIQKNEEQETHLDKTLFPNVLFSQLNTGSSRKHPKKEKISSYKRTQKKSQCSLRPSHLISSRSETEYSVHQDLIRLYTSKLSRMETLAHAYWYKGKKEKGILLAKIPCKSPLRNLGLLPKDIILSVNGKSIHNNWSAFGGYMELKSQKNFNIVLKRGSRQLSMKYHIVKKI